MSNPYVQAESILIGQIPALGKGRPFEKHFDSVTIKPSPDNQIILPDFKCHTFVTIFGSNPTDPTLNSPLDLQQLIHVSVLLCQHQKDPLSIELLKNELDLRNLQSFSRYYPSSDVCTKPFVRACFTSGPWENFDVPSYGLYFLKTYLKIEGTDEKFFIQNVCPIEITLP